MATFDISEVNNAVQITENGNFKQFQKGYLSIDDPSNDVILYIIRDGKQQYKINTDTDTITVNEAPFVGDSNDLKDAINPFFFNASSVAGGAQTVSNVIIQEDTDNALQPVINQGTEGSVGLEVTVTVSDASNEDIVVLGHFSSIVGSAGNSELTFRTYINNVLASETDPYRVGNTAQSLDFRTTSLRPLNASGVFTLDIRVYAVSGNITIDNTDGSRIEVAQNKSITIQSGSGGGGGSTAWGDITGDINNQTDLPYTVSNTVDANFKGDVYADGEFFAQGNSIIFENQLSLGSSGTTPFFSNLDTGEVAYISGSKVDSGVSSAPTYFDRYNPFTKNDPNGQPQPDDSLTFNSTPFVETLTGENKYYFAVTLTSTSQLVSDTWYLRSLTGFTNSYLKAFKGVETDPNADDVFWKTNTNKQIKEKTGLVTDAGGAGIDITYPLGNSFIESINDEFTYIFIADNNFTVQGQNFGIDIPYTKGDGAEWRESSVSSNSNSYSFQKDYDFETNTADSDPGGGKLKFNNADLNLATFMYISQFAKNSVDNDSILSTLSSGDCLMVENTQNASNKVKWCLTSDPVKSGNYYKLEGSSASVSGAFAGQMNLITTFFLSEQPSFSTISQNGTASDKNVLIRKADLSIEERNLSFSDITGGSISRSSIIYQYSTTDQFPVNTNIYYPFNFGNGSDIITSDLTLSSSGELTVNTTGQYYFRVFGHFGRVGTSGTSKCLFYGEADFGGGWVLIPNGLSKVFMVTNTNDFESFEFETFFTIPAGVKFRYGMVRDSSGNNDGGVYSFVPNYVGASPFPSIGLDISKLITS